MINKCNNEGGFTLIELIMIIVILGMLAAVSFPKYQDIALEAKKEICKNSLMSMRSAISIWQMNNVVKSHLVIFPDINSLRNPNTVLIQVPPNPFQSENKAPDSVVLGVVKGVRVGFRGGWAYKPSTGEIWANTITYAGGSGCSGGTLINENLW